MPPTTETKIQTSAGMETATETVDRINRTRANTTISANDLATPPPVENPPAPATGTIPTSTMQVVGNVAADNTSFIEAQSEEQRMRDERMAEYAALGADTSLSELFNTKSQEFGATPKALQELKDIDLQLADMQTGSDLKKVRISGAAGQTLGQGLRELTQEDREAAVRSAGLAARASVLRGNIETARSLAKDAVSIAFQERQLKNQNLINQINWLSDRVDDQTAQLLEQERRDYEADLARVEELKTNISEAIVSGASQTEIAQLNDPNVPDDQKLALAQSIIATKARTDIEMDRETERLQQDNIRNQMYVRNENLKIAQNASTNNPNGTIDGKPQNNSQSTANGYADRLVEANRVLTGLDGKFAGDFQFGAILPRQLQTPERQQFEQAKRNFINAVLRRESGAVISDQEFDNAAQQYFEQPGDSSEVRIQKAENRNTVINNLYREANVARPVAPGDIIVSDGVRYLVEDDGVSITPLN